jgi:hypothetical protein
MKRGCFRLRPFAGIDLHMVLLPALLRALLQALANFPLDACRFLALVSATALGRGDQEAIADERLAGAAIELRYDCLPLS